MKYRLITLLALILLGACSHPSLKPGGDVQMLSGESWLLQGDVLENPIPARVPGTVLGCFVKAGLMPDPHFGDNVLAIPDSLFCTDFLYSLKFRSRIDAPRQFLHFEGINWKAEVKLNGHELGRIEGAFRSQDFDVTGILKNGGNELEVKIIHNDNYGESEPRTIYSTGHNGGILGADNPTMHATIGWDWIPVLPGRNMGIYEDVWLYGTGEVTIDDPFVRTELPLPDTTSAFVFAEACLTNRSGAPVSGVLKGSYGPVEFSREVSLQAGEQRVERFDSLLFENPRLWWPNGYGEQYLYDVNFTFEAAGILSDSKSFRSGVRQMDYVLEYWKPVSKDIIPGGYTKNMNDQRLLMYVNGRRFIGFGGNWGYPELMLGYGEREYDIAVGYHADMNFTMIRDWVGMTSHRAFYDACDRHGIMVWQDFWLANPWDGPDPADEEMFCETARRYVRRIRNHPSIAIYVGRNEGYPPESIDRYLDSAVAAEHPGIHYHSHSAADGVNGGGPYKIREYSDYFHLFGHDATHSERGMPAVMNYEDLVRTMGADGVEPYSSMEHPNFMYAMHDYTLGVQSWSAQAVDTFNKKLESTFGVPADAREFSEYAQWLNFEGYRAIFEGRSEYRQGMLLWMSHPAWPSMVWQTYDWYFEPTAAYFGCKKACEPLHILYNRWLGDIQVVNYHAGLREGLTARAELLDMYGKTLWSESCGISIQEDETVRCFPLVLPKERGDVYYLRLTLSDLYSRELSTNFYLLGRNENNLQALKELPDAALEAVYVEKAPGRYDVRLSNTGDVPALMLRLKVTDAGGSLVLPVHYSENYIHLMPGEDRLLSVSVNPDDSHGVSLTVSGYNLEPLELENVPAVYPFRDRSLSAEERAADLLSRLTLDEKADLSRFDSPAVSRLGVKPYNWWNEALHGVARNGSATVFPMPIAMAASFDEALVEQVFTTVSDEARIKHKIAADAGEEDIYNGLTFWTPNINIFRDPRWGRGMETYGEDPCLTGRMGASVVRGLQGPAGSPVQKLHACAKHFAVHSGTERNRHQFDAQVSERDLRETYLPAFKQLVDAGVKEVMTAYNRFRGVPCSASSYLVDTILRKEWGYDGLVISDCWAISDFYEPNRHGYVQTREEAAAAAAKTGLQLECGSSFRGLAQAVRMGLLDESVLDTNLLPLLAERFKLGEMDGESPWDGLDPSLVEGPEHRALSLKMAEESLVLLQNRDGILPLASGARLALVGPNADDKSMQWGNYNPVPKQTVTLLEAMLEEYPDLVYQKGCGHTDGLCDVDSLISALENVDVVVFAGGISPRLEGEEMPVKIPGFDCGDRTDLELPAVQRELLGRLHDAGKKVVLVNFSGSAMGLVPETGSCDAILQAWYPGEEGGTAIMNVLSGRVAPSGKLPVTFYRSVADLPDAEDYNMEGHTYRYFRGEPLYPFGYGLSYASFEYGKPVVKGRTLEVKVTNTGTCDAAEVVQLYVSRPDDPDGPIRTLRDWKRVLIPAGKTVKVSFPLTDDTFVWWSEEAGDMVVLPGTYQLHAGGNFTTFALPE